MSVPKARYATTLVASISDSSASIVVANINYLNGKSASGTANAALAAGDFIRLLMPSAVTPGTYIAEVMEVTTVTALTGTQAQIDVNRADGTFGGTPAETSGLWAPNGSGVVTHTATASTNYAFLAGATVENIEANALLRNASAGTTADDAVFNYDNGSVRFLNVGNTGSANFAVDSGMTISIFGDYKTASSKRVGLGVDLPNIEFIVELQHKMTDGRYFVFKGHKMAVTSENTEFAFVPDNWIGTSLVFDALVSKDPAHIDDPLGYFDVQNDPVTLLPVADTTDNYAVGVYDLFVTPTSATKAIQRGLPTTRFNLGNIRLGNLRMPKTYLEHLKGIPQDLDKKILIRRQLGLDSTIEELTAENISLLFDGKISAVGAGFRPFNSLVSVSAAPDAPYSVSHVWHPLGYILINVA